MLETGLTYIQLLHQMKACTSGHLICTHTKQPFKYKEFPKIRGVKLVPVSRFLAGSGLLLHPQARPVRRPQWSCTSPSWTAPPQACSSHCALPWTNSSTGSQPPAWICALPSLLHPLEERFNNFYNNNQQWEHYKYLHYHGRWKGNAFQSLTVRESMHRFKLEMRRKQVDLGKAHSLDLFRSSAISLTGLFTLKLTGDIINILYFPSILKQCLNRLSIYMDFVRGLRKTIKTTESFFYKLNIFGSNKQKTLLLNQHNLHCSGMTSCSWW